MEKKTVYITRNALFKNLSMILCNNIEKIDESFIDDNHELFYTDCEKCEGTGVIENKEGNNADCDECNGEGRFGKEFYQYFITDADAYDIERLKEYGVDVGYSEKLENNIICIGDFGTSWSAFSYSKEVDADYTLEHDETLTRTTVY